MDDGRLESKENPIPDAGWLISRPVVTTATSRPT